MKRLLHRVLNGFGLDIVRSAHLHADLGAHLKNVLAAARIDCVLDVGANAGQYGHFLRSLGYEGQIVSFEPVPSVFQELCKASDGDDAWDCRPVALGDQRGEKAMNVYEGTMFSSFLPASAYARRTWASVRKGHQENVRVERLDAILDEVAPQARRCLLKLDTQGFDLQAFRGARGAMERIAALQSEISFIPVYDGVPPATRVLDEYAQAGFAVSGMYPVNRDPSLAVVEFDCVMIRRPPQPGPGRP